MILTKADIIVNKAAVNSSSDNMQLVKLNDEDIKKNKESLFATGESEAEKLKQRTGLTTICINGKPYQTYLVTMNTLGHSILQKM